MTIFPNISFHQIRLQHGSPFFQHLLLPFQPISVGPAFSLMFITIRLSEFGVRTLAARKAFDEPLELSIRRKEAEHPNRFRPYATPPSASGTTPSPTGSDPINLEVVPKTVAIFNNGELTIVPRRSPSPPQVRSMYISDFTILILIFFKDEPMDFSTKKKDPVEAAEANKPRLPLPTYTSSRELRFAKNLKLIVVGMMRKNPAKARIVLDYLKHAWNKSKALTTTTASSSATSSSASSASTSRSNSSEAAGPPVSDVKIQQCAATGGQPPSYSQVSDGGQGGSGGSAGSSGGGGGVGGSSGSGGGGGGPPGGGAGGSGGGGPPGGGGHGNGGHGHYGPGGSSNNNNNNNNNNNEDEDGNNNNNTKGGTIVDMEGSVNFDELTAAGQTGGHSGQVAPQNTAKWFQDHPDINAGKILDGLLSLKTEFPDETSNGSGGSGGTGSGGLEKPPDLGALDHATANLLQMSVPDPSQTFMDIGTELGGASLYEDDPFSLETLLPSNFNINQLDLLPGSPDQHTTSGSGNHGGQGGHGHPGAHVLGAETSMSLTAKNLMTSGGGHQTGSGGPGIIMGGSTSGNSQSMHQLHPGPPGQGGQGHPSHHSAISMSLYPETTIRPLGLPVGTPTTLTIKQEPLAYIKREDNNNAAGNSLLPGPSFSQQHPGAGHLQAGQIPPGHGEPPPGYHHYTPGVSPLSSMGSPGSPPTANAALYEKNQAAMAIAALSGGGVASPRLPGGPGPSGSGHHGPIGHPGMPSSSGAGHPGGPPMPGGGKMKASTSGMNARKKAAGPTTTPEEDELLSIPSLQMRIKILQQRVSTTC